MMCRAGCHARLAFVMAALVACLVTCGGGEPPTRPTSPSPGVTAYIVSNAPHGPVLFVGKTRSYFASLYSASSPVQCGSWRWESSNPAVAVISATSESRNSVGTLLSVASSATITTVAAGVVILTATCVDNGVTATFTEYVHRPCSISGTVIDDLGRPVEGAGVGTGPVPGEKGPGRGTQTDASGHYLLADLPDDFMTSITVSKAGHQTMSKALTLLTDTVLDFTLPRGVQVHGTVTEPGVGVLGDATIEVTSGPDAGRVVTSLAGGAYVTAWLLPGTITLRASKSGYDPVEHTVTTAVNAIVDFALTRSYGPCLASVSPVVFDPFTSGGGDATTAVTANAGRGWTASSSDSWIQVLSGASGGGTGRATLAFRVLSSEGAADLRRGAIAIRCTGAEGQSAWGQDVRVVQLPACHAKLEWDPSSPTQFPPSGVPMWGDIRVTTAVPNCYWRALADADWVHLWNMSFPYQEGRGNYTLSFRVDANTTGRDRTATIVIAELPWTVTQKGQ